MISTRVLVASYVVLLLSLAAFWCGLHLFSMWALYTLFAVGFVAALVTVVHPWLRTSRPSFVEKKPGASALSSNRAVDADVLSAGRRPPTAAGHFDV